MTPPRIRMVAGRIVIGVAIVAGAGGFIVTKDLVTASIDHRHHRPGSIIGADTPQLIPDEVAYTQILNAMATLASSPHGDRVLRGYFIHMENTAARIYNTEPASFRFTQNDRDSLMAIAAELNNRSRDGLAVPGSGPTRSALITSAVARFRTDLTPRAAAILNAFATYGVKPRMKGLR